MFLTPFIKGRPVRAVGGAVEPPVRLHSVALLGADYPGLRADLRVKEGDAVVAGQVLFTDRKHPDIAFVAPASGRVASVTFAAGRRLSALIVELDGDKAEKAASAPIRVGTAGEARALLLSRGLWPAFRSRPFGRIPEPDARADAIFVNAMAGFDGAPDPAALLPGVAEEFAAGLRLLTLLTEGAVLTCFPEGLELPEIETPGIRRAFFAPHPMTSMTSHHVAQLHGQVRDRPVWNIGWQDVVAIGQLLRTGQFPGERIVAITDAHSGRPVLKRALLGVSLHDLFAGTAPPATNLISGPAISGNEALWLSRYDTSAARIVPPQTSNLWKALTSSRGALRPILPHAGLDTVLPVGIPAVPFLRALTVGDAESVEKLGGRALVEEDMLRASHRCTSGTDYAAKLRTVLDRMEAEG